MESLFCVLIFQLKKDKSKKKRSVRPTCSVLIKHMKEQGDVYLGHNSWHEYRAMTYRVLKRYSLNYHTLPGGNEVVPGHTLTMSSYIGTILSLDDFLLTSAQLATTETTLFIYDKELFRDADYTEDVVMEGARVMTANRLANNGPEWMDTFRKHNSGTYNNQWMVVDYKKLAESPEDPKDETLMVAEQIPGQVIVRDQSSELRTVGHWISFNRATYPETQEMVGQNKKEEQYGDWFSRNNTARAKILTREQEKVNKQFFMGIWHDLLFG